MSYTQLTFSLEGIVPLLLHNGQLADPANEHAKAMKVIIGKRKKTEADYEALSRVEFLGSLYLNEDGKVAIPGEMIEAMLVEGGKQYRMGKQFKAGVIVDHMSPLKHDGPSDPHKLFETKRFVDKRGVIVSRSRVIRTRPIFRVWSLEVTVNYLPSVLNQSQVLTAMEKAGELVGLGDYRPRFGRFEVKEVLA